MLAVHKTCIKGYWEWEPLFSVLTQIAAEGCGVCCNNWCCFTHVSNHTYHQSQFLTLVYKVFQKSLILGSYFDLLHVWQTCLEMAVWMYKYGYGYNYNEIKNRESTNK